MASQLNLDPNSLDFQAKVLIASGVAPRGGDYSVHKYSGQGGGADDIARDYAALPQSFKTEALAFPGGTSSDFMNYMGGLVPIQGGNGIVWTEPAKAQQELAAGKSLSPAFQSQYSSTGQATGGSFNPTAANTEVDQQFKEYLENSGLPDDQKAALQAIFDTVSTGDQAKAQQLKSAFAAATQYSSPYFKAQSRLVLDSLDRAFNAADGDLDFEVKQRENSLKELRDDITASKDHLDFNTRQELEGLARTYEVNLENTRQSLANTGFTQSSRRDRTETMMSDAYGSAVESKNRTLAYQTGALDRQLTSADQSTQLQIANLQRLASEGKLDSLRGAEEKVGTGALQTAGYENLLGGVGGTIPRQQSQDAISFANSFVF